jgi:hypothetical protein
VQEHVLEDALAGSEGRSGEDEQESLPMNPEAVATRSVIDYIAEQHELCLAGQWVDLHSLRKWMMARGVAHAACEDEPLLVACQVVVDLCLLELDGTGYRVRHKPEVSDDWIHGDSDVSSEGPDACS